MEETLAAAEDLAVEVQDQVVEVHQEQQTLAAAEAEAASAVEAVDQVGLEELELKNLQYLQYQQYLKLWLQMEFGN